MGGGVEEEEGACHACHDDHDPAGDGYGEEADDVEGTDDVEDHMAGTPEGGVL